MNRLRRGNLYLYSSITTRFSCRSHVTLYDSDLIYTLLPNINDNIRFWFTRVHNFLFKYSLYIYIIHIHIWLWDCQCIFCVLKSRTFLGNICLVACHVLVCCLYFILSTISFNEMKRNGSPACTPAGYVKSHMFI